MKTTNASTARKSFARLLESVISDDEPVVIVRYREAIAAIVPISRLHPAERALLKNRRDIDDGRGRRDR
jgi:PHD/YefM family antitoxin component YafN of YafNO toxin-antitoxin module